jgi:hypothetical protein
LSEKQFENDIRAAAEKKTIQSRMASKKYIPNNLHVSPTSLSEAQRLANRTTGLYLTRFELV